MNNTQEKIHTSLQTDFYQLTMSYAYLVAGKADEETSFESFVRRVKPEISGDKGYYIFQGEYEVKEFMGRVKEEFESEDYFDRFWDRFSKKIENSEEVYQRAKGLFEKMKKTFKYTVVPNGTKVYPMVPAFQFKGSRFIGQMIETPITNIINGRTGFETYKTSFPENIEDIEKKKFSLGDVTSKEYLELLRQRAKEYRAATSKPLVEGAFRRAPSYAIAYVASQIAIEEGWDKTSNTSLFGIIDTDLIAGTMAHAFVMAFDTEVEAFREWNKIFPKSIILVDTYDTFNAVKTLIDENIKPMAVRIDSDPLEFLTREVRKILDSAGWYEVKIFISGDITPEKLIKWEKEDLPFDMSMAGTHYVNIGWLKETNSGFVYKTVEYTVGGKTRYPVKKASGKSNYPGIKTVEVDKGGNIVMSIGQSGFGFGDLEKISENAKVFFEGGEDVSIL